MLRGSLGQAYRRVLWANTVSSVGAGVYVAALPLLAYTVTRDPRLIAFVSAAEFLPWLVWSLPAGVIVDRYDRAVLMWRSQVVQGVIIAMIAVLLLVHEVDIGVLILVGFLLGSAEVIFSNAAQSVLPNLVPAEQLPKANGNLQVSLTVGETCVGPPLGSVLFSVSRVLPFGLNACTFFGSAALLSGLPKRAEPAPVGAPARAPMVAQIGEGLSYLFRHRLLRVVAVLLGVMNFASQMGGATLVLLAVQTLHTGTRGYGLLWTASAVGAIVGGMTNPVLTRRLGMLASLIIALVLTAAVSVGIGLAPDAFVAGALFAVNGYSVTMWNVVTVSLRQRIVPGELLGRVNSVYRMIGWGLIPVGAVTGGFVAKEWGFRAPYTLGGIVIALVGVFTVPVLIRAVRAAGQPVVPSASVDDAVGVLPVAVVVLASAGRACLTGISNRIRHSIRRSPAAPPMIVGHACRKPGPGGPRSWNRASGPPGMPGSWRGRERVEQPAEPLYPTSRVRLTWRPPSVAWCPAGWTRPSTRPSSAIRPSMPSGRVARSPRSSGPGQFRCVAFACCRSTSMPTGRRWAGCPRLPQLGS
jgi:MFS family permease